MRIRIKMRKVKKRMMVKKKNKMKNRLKNHKIRRKRRKEGNPQRTKTATRVRMIRSKQTTIGKLGSLRHSLRGKKTRKPTSLRRSRRHKRMNRSLRKRIQLSRRNQRK